MAGRAWLENRLYVLGGGSWYYPSTNYPHIHVGFTSYSADTVDFIAFHAHGMDRAVGLYNNGAWSRQSGDLRVCGMDSGFIQELYILCIEYHLGTP